MNKLEINKRMLIGIMAARSAGKILTLYYKKIKSLKIKNNSPRDIISRVDIMSEKEIYKLITRSFKNDSFLGEETGLKKKNSNFKWVVDPLDGTVNYTHGIPLYAISIAIFYKEKCVAGIIYNSKDDEMYYASLNQGAYMNGRRINVSNEMKLKNSLIIAILPSKIKNKNKTYKLFSKLNEKSRGVLRIGSAAIAYTFLASGKVEAIWGFDNKIWDVSAGILLNNEANGKTSSNNDKKYNYKNTLISSNKLIHKDLLNYIT